MFAKLRQVGNSIGLTIPANELQSLHAQASDTVEINITRIIHKPRNGWDNPSCWVGADEDKMLLNATTPAGGLENNLKDSLEDILENSFDETEWQW